LPKISSEEILKIIILKKFRKSEVLVIRKCFLIDYKIENPYKWRTFLTENP
jgi:hypothetical protein